MKIYRVLIFIGFVGTGCAASQKNADKLDNAAYLQAEEILKKPLSEQSAADLKVMVQQNPDFDLSALECNYSEHYQKENTCSTRKLRNNQSLYIKCVGLNDTGYPTQVRGTCAKEICIDTNKKECRSTTSKADAEALLLK